MEAVILAGGLGERLKPLTDRVAKVMAPLGNRPFIYYLLKLLKRGGVDKAVLCIGYLGWQVKDYVGSSTHWGMEVTYSEDDLLGTGGALKKAEPLLGDWFIVVNGDTYLPIRHSDVAQRFLATNCEAMMVVYDKDPETGARDVLVENTVVVKSSKSSPDPDFNYVNAGVLLLRHKALRFIPSGPVSLEEGLYPSLVKHRLMAAYITKERYYDIGTPERLAKFDSFIRRRIDYHQDPFPY